jgi:hypothetical protein
MLHQVMVEVLVSEVSSSITNHHPWTPKRGNIISSNIFLEFLASAALHGMASTHFET